MNIAAYNMAQSHYSATCAVLKNHLGSCSRCRVNPANDADGGVYCDIGLSALDEALRAQAELDQTARDTIAGYCLDCD